MRPWGPSGAGAASLHGTMPLYRRLDGSDEIKPLFDTSDEEVLARLGGPTLLRLPGTDANPAARVVACLLHGNEDSGFRAVARLLRSGARFPFDLWVFIGNVEAAVADGAFGHRYLEGQEDFNRIWRREPALTPERKLATAVLDELEAAAPEAVLDLHNTSGDNPPHAVVPDRADRGAERTVALAAACIGLVLQWRLEAHTLMEAMAPICPAIAVECGIAGRPEHVDVAADVLHRFLHLDPVPDAGQPEQRFEMRERVVVRPEASFAFDAQLRPGLDLALAPDLDAANFGMLFAGAVIGRCPPGRDMPLRANDMDGRDTTDEAFALGGDGRIRLQRDVTPVMMTRSVIQTRRDCLFYIARRR